LSSKWVHIIIIMRPLILSREFRLLPLQVQWAKVCARVWNKTIRGIKTLQEESYEIGPGVIKKRQYKMLDCTIPRGHGAHREGGRFLRMQCNALGAFFSNNISSLSVLSST
jgi:hypothetical protein